MALTKRQKQIYDYVTHFIETNGYSPSLEEIGREFQLSSVATVHKHVTNLVRKGLLRRTWNQNRSIDIVREESAPRAVDVPILGRLVSGHPIFVEESAEVLPLPSWLIGQGRTYLLRAEGDDMLHEHVRSGDLLVVEDRRALDEGALVVVVLPNEEPAMRRLLRTGSTLRFRGLRPGDPDLDVPADQVEAKSIVRGLVRTC